MFNHVSYKIKNILNTCSILPVKTYSSNYNSNKQSNVSLNLNSTLRQVSRNFNLKLTSNLNSVYQYNIQVLIVSWIKTYNMLLLSFFYRDSFLYIRNLFIILLIDSLVTDDEPLWEPLEWSLIQTWLLFIFLFSWAVENMISSRYGSYTGRDKRVWLALYKSFWLIEIWFLINFGIACIFIISPFYFEVNYLTSCIVLWWNWYNVMFFFKYTSFLLLLVLITYSIQLGFNWLNPTKIIILYLLLITIVFYLLYTTFIITFFSYFTNLSSYQNYRPNSYVQLSQTPNKWGWGPLDRDHFTHHHTTLTFWYKNDSPYAYALFLLNNFFFLSLFLLYIQLIIGIRFVYSVKHSNYNFITYLNSLIKHFFLIFLYFNIFILFCLLFQWMRISYDFSIYYNYTSIYKSFIYYVIDIINYLYNCYLSKLLKL